MKLYGIQIKEKDEWVLANSNSPYEPWIFFTKKDALLATFVLNNTVRIVELEVTVREPIIEEVGSIRTFKIKGMDGLYRELGIDEPRTVDTYALKELDKDLRHFVRI